MAKIELQPKQYPIGQLLDYTQIQGFIVPDFQRTYTWKVEHCIQLWEDIYEAYRIAKKQRRGDGYKYFLGSIIVYPDRDNKQEMTIIDGQQRITTLLLLLRAIYTSMNRKLQDAITDELVNGLKERLKELEQLLFNPQTNIFDTGIDKATPRLTRRNIVGEDYFAIIMKSGRYTEDEDSNYSPERIYNEYNRISSASKVQINDTLLNKLIHSNECVNYAYFLSVTQNAEYQELKEIILFITKLCIVLVIKSEDEESSLDIFDILNNRGMQLSDADIFKNRIQKTFREKGKNDLQDQWTELIKVLKTAPPSFNMSLDQVFKLYMFAIRCAHTVENKSKEPKLRDFFTKDPLGKDKLENLNIVKDLRSLAEFVMQVLSIEDNDNVLIDDEVKYDISLLNKYQKNGGWINLISTFWYCYQGLVPKEPTKFKNRFKKFIRFCTSVLFLKSILTLSASDADIPQLCEKLAKQAASEGLIKDFEISFKLDSSSQIQERIIENRRILNGELLKQSGRKKENRLDTAKEILKNDTTKLNHLVLLYTYHLPSKNGEKQPILNSMTIEHILPQNWETNYGTQWRKEFRNNDEKINDYVEHLGNKIILARERNIRASDREFSSKIRAYSDCSKTNSKITLELKQFIEEHKKSTKWTKNDVDKRTDQMIDVIIAYIKNGIKAGIA